MADEVEPCPFCEDGKPIRGFGASPRELEGASVVLERCADLVTGEEWVQAVLHLGDAEDPDLCLPFSHCPMCGRRLEP